MILDLKHVNERGTLFSVEHFTQPELAAYHVAAIKRSGVAKRVSVRQFKRLIRVDGLEIVMWFVVTREKPR